MSETPANSIAVFDQVGLKRGERSIFNNLSITIPAGQITAIMGPSGCGKTSLLRLLGGQLKPGAGSVSLFGQNVGRCSAPELLALRRRIGVLFQNGALFSDLSVFDNVAFPLRQHTRLPEHSIRDLVLIRLQMVGLRGARALMPSELSGGMARRVALARAIVLDPELILYDEPFAGQDPISMGVLRELIEQINKVLGITSIVVSHDIPETSSISDHIHIIADGGVVASGTPAQLRQTSNALVKQFIAGEADGPIPFHFPAPDYRADLHIGTPDASRSGGRPC
jgi:phospholipid/cholesterol/gamma-HCH transport system ATP-binding protein